MSNTQDLKQVLDKKMSILQGDAGRIAGQRAQGKLTARERIAKLLDQGSFVETGVLFSAEDNRAGVVTGYGTVEDRPVYIFAQDYTVKGGAMGVRQAEKILRVLDLAQKTGAPVIAMCDSAGIRIDEGAEAMNAYAQVYARMARLSGVCPMIAVLCGPCIGAAAYISQLCDVTIMAEKVGSLMVYGAQVLSAAGKTYTDETAGGAKAMAAQGGVALTAENEDAAIALCAEVLALLPGCNAEDAPIVENDDMNRLLPAVAADDAASLMAAMADAGSCIELYKEFGKEIRVALTRLGGRSCGLVVSDAKVNGGALTPDGAAKAARFIRLCDCYSMPVVSLVNSCGVAVPDQKDQVKTMTAVSQLLYAYAEATTAKVSFVIGNAIGQSFVAMAGKGSADMSYAWPGAVISALTPDQAVEVLYTEEIKKGTDAPAVTRAKLADKFAADVADGVAAARAGMIDDVIDPADTRKLAIAAIEMLSSKRESNPPKKHGNLPL